METKIMVAKYSIFGDYDYINNTPENVSKLYELFGKDYFMPNILTLFKIEQPNNILTTLERPQLINKSMPCTISFLPERIDIETEADVNFDQVTKFLDELINLFDLKINRIALYKSTVFEALEKNESERLKEIAAPPKNYSGEENLIEYASHRVNRVKFDCLDELININRNLTGIPSIIDGVYVFNKLQVETDINTLGENTANRFMIEHCQNFFETALNYDGKILDDLKEFIYEY